MYLNIIYIASLHVFYIFYIMHGRIVSGA